MFQRAGKDMHTYLNIFKKGEKKLSGNYRPVYQASVLRKILGKIRTKKKKKKDDHIFVRNM